MSPLRRVALVWAERHPNIVIAAVLGILVFDTAAGASALIDNRDQTSRLAHVVAEQRIERIRSDAKLCRSVKQGKLDRISEYHFTIDRTKAFYAQNPALPTKNLAVTIRFYDDLIRRTKAGIVNCPPIPE